MARPVYPHELSDPDFTWLVNSFREQNPHYFLFETSYLPVVFIVDDRPLGNNEQLLLPQPEGDDEAPESVEK